MPTIEKHHLLSDFQFGGRAGRRPQDAAKIVLDLTDHAEPPGRRFTRYPISIDWAKAYDKNTFFLVFFFLGDLEIASFYNPKPS
jgi:hypothetical protein